MNKAVLNYSHISSDRATPVTPPHCISTRTIFGIAKISANSFRDRGGDVEGGKEAKCEKSMQPHGSLFSLLIGRGREDPFFLEIGRASCRERVYVLV